MRRPRPRRPRRRPGDRGRPRGGSAQASSATPFPGDQVDVARRAGSADLDVARDGTGAVVYVKPDGGVDHVFAEPADRRRLRAARAARRRASPAAAAQPVVAATDGGRLVAVFTAGGARARHGAPGPPRRAWTAPQVLGHRGERPVGRPLDQRRRPTRASRPPAAGAPTSGSRAWSTPPPRSPSSTRRWTSTPRRPRAPARAAPRVSVAADGSAVVAWGGGAATSSPGRVFERRASVAPQRPRRPATPSTSRSRTTRASAGSSSARAGAVVARRLLGVDLRPARSRSAATRRSSSPPAVAGRPRGRLRRRSATASTGRSGRCSRTTASTPAVGSAAASAWPPAPAPRDGLRTATGSSPTTRAEPPARPRCAARCYDLAAGLARRTAPSPRGRCCPARARPGRPGAAACRRRGPRSATPPSRSSRAPTAKLVVAVYDRPPGARSYSLGTAPLARRDACWPGAAAATSGARCGGHGLRRRAAGGPALGTKRRPRRPAAFRRRPAPLVGRGHGPAGAAHAARRPRPCGSPKRAPRSAAGPARRATARGRPPRLSRRARAPAAAAPRRRAARRRRPWCATWACADEAALPADGARGSSAIMIASADGRAAVERALGGARAAPPTATCCARCASEADAMLVGPGTLRAERYANLLDRRPAGAPRWPRAARALRGGDDRAVARPCPTEVGALRRARGQRCASTPRPRRGGRLARRRRRRSTRFGRDAVARARCLRHLRAEAARGRVACEGGPTLLRELVADGSSTTSCSRSRRCSWPATRCARCEGPVLDAAGRPRAARASCAPATTSSCTTPPPVSATDAAGSRDRRASSCGPGARWSWASSTRTRTRSPTRAAHDARRARSSTRCGSSPRAPT